ncbi:hypothetical protein [Rubritalea tangerina]|uniref:hypothetical protein n=1 Tax=Rubritalea tangerina TaxID=430798 RepID=UPI003621D19A
MIVILPPNAFLEQINIRLPNGDNGTHPMIKDRRAYFPQPRVAQPTRGNRMIA